MPTPNLDLIFERWKASFQHKSKKRDAVSSNFDELFDNFNSAGATFEEAHSYLEQAIKVHLPSPSVAKVTWKTLKNSPINTEMTEKEFIDGWNKDIGEKATCSFYNVYPLPEDKDDDKEPKVYGQMSAKEYKLQRKHADSYPIFDTEELEKRLPTGIYDPVADLLDKDKNGKS